jgi:hypothetical protein
VGVVSTGAAGDVTRAALVHLDVPAVVEERGHVRRVDVVVWVEALCLASSVSMSAWCTTVLGYQLRWVRRPGLPGAMSATDPVQVHW